MESNHPTAIGMGTYIGIGPILDAIPTLELSLDWNTDSQIWSKW